MKDAGNPLGKGTSDMSETGQKTTLLEEFKPQNILKAEDYESYIGQERWRSLNVLQNPLLIGGGVSEILRSSIQDWVRNCLNSD